MIRMIPVISSHFGSSRPVERAVDLRSAVYIIDLSTLGFTPAPRVSLQRSVDPFPGDGGRQAEDHVPLQHLLGSAGDTGRALLVRGLRRLRVREAPVAATKGAMRARQRVGPFEGAQI